jgi:hypothetical protein
MKHRLWFRLAIKTAGLLILVQVLPSLVRTTVYHLNYFFTVAIGGLPAATYDWRYSVQSFAADGLLIACGLYLLLRGKWLLNWVLPPASLCEQCGYDIMYCKGDRCPECGTPLPAHETRGA